MKSATSTPVRIDSLVVEAADRFTDEIKDGLSPSIEAYAKRYPQIADIIRNIFPALAVLDGSSLAGLSDANTDAPVTGVLGDFRILREIGRGGMGVVYEAEQISLGRRVALKVLPFAAMLDKQQLARFKNEARAAATLDHSNIVAVYSVGTERGVHYYAMQLVEGQSLAEVIEALRKGSGISSRQSLAPTAAFPPKSEIINQKSQITSSSNAAIDTQPVAVLSTLPDSNSPEYFRAVARLGVQAAEALDHAHQNGILHRDIKPANLMVDDVGKLWVTDFGLARIERDAGLTMTGDLLGTLRYMSPEQSLGLRVVVDHRSDVYSLGVTLYELLTLQPAFPDDDRQELLRQIAQEEPSRPRQVNARIPADLETIVLKAMEKNPADRYATAKDLAEDLGRFLKHEPIMAKSPSPWLRATKWLRRHQALTASTLVALVFLLIGASGLTADHYRQVREGNRFVKMSLEAARQALEADKIDQAEVRVSEALARIETDHLTKRVLLDDASQLQQEIRRYTRFLPLYERAKYHRSAEEATIAPAQEALSLYSVMEEPDWLHSMRNAALPEAHVTRITESVYELLLLRADHLTRWYGDWPKSTRQARLEVQCQEALQCLEKAVSFHEPSRGYYWLKANCSKIIGDKDKENRLRHAALEAPVQSASELFYINRDHVWGTVSHNAGYAKYSFEDCFKDHREMLRFDPTYYNAMFFMPYRLAQEGRHAEALLGWYACVSLRPDDCIAIMNRGSTHADLGQIDEARADFELAVSKQPDKPTVLGGVAANLAVHPRDEIRDGARAVALATKACELTRYEDPDLIDTLACAHAEAGDFESAIKWGEIAVEVSGRQAEYAKHLENFRQLKPWREEAK